MAILIEQKAHKTYKFYDTESKEHRTIIFNKDDDFLMIANFLEAEFERGKQVAKQELKYEIASILEGNE